MLEILSQPQRWVIPAVLLVSAVGAVLAVWWDKRHPTSYTRRQGTPVGTVRQDQAALDAGELAEQGRVRGLGAWRRWEPDAVADASEAAQIAAARMAEAAKRNALFHP